jgi:hypothetical protein
LTLLAALCWRRQSEITDALVDLLIGLREGCHNGFLAGSPIPRRGVHFSAYSS